MNRKKTMQGWQMIVSVVLLAAMLITLFLPAFQFNGNRLKKTVQKLDTTGNLSQDVMDQMADNFDDTLKAAAEEGTDLSYISAGKIMVTSAETFFQLTNEDREDEETMELFAPVRSGYNQLRTIFWVVYIVDLIVLILMILGFVLGWVKYIALGISTAYSVLVIGAFSYLQFMTPGKVAKSNAIQNLAEQSLGSAFNLISNNSALTDILKKLITGFYGFAFIAGLVLAVLLLILSVVSMFVGGQEWITLPDGRKVTPEEYQRIQDEERQRREWEEQQRQQRMQMEREEKERKKQREAQERQRQMEAQQKQQAQAVMGKVMCIKGVATGQGFSLPETSKVVVGKNPQYANLVIKSPHVSNVHCSIRYKAATNTYIVKDHSSNGTYVNGVRLQKDVPLVFPEGTVLQLADGSNEIKLG